MPFSFLTTGFVCLETAQNVAIYMYLTSQSWDAEASARTGLFVLLVSRLIVL
jgi:hypothetical protein